MNQAQNFRDKLNGTGLIVAPGVYDGLTAKLSESAGFGAVYMTGAGTAMSRGYPDYGLLGLDEMADNAGVIARTVNIPVIADADTGFGNELNVVRCVREYRQRGVAALHIEDQVMPKRCGHLDGKELVSREDFVAKIRAAVWAREGHPIAIIARTDARAVSGLDEAIWRANAALEAGADMAFVEAAQTMDEVESIPRRVNGPCLLNIVIGGKTPDVTLELAEQMGYRVAILPSMLISPISTAIIDSLEQLKATGKPQSSVGQMPVKERFRRMGADAWDEMRTRFRDPA